MRLKEILDLIQKTAKDNGFSHVFICGGIPRDKVRGVVKEINDVDLTTENGDAVKLSFTCAKVLPNANFNYFDDGHTTIRIDNLKIDFSNHFIIPGIDLELNRLGIKHDTPLYKEMYSRDFTINTLLQELDFNKVYDITTAAIDDIKTGIIRTPINPELTIKHDPKRILRALRFAIKFDYIIDSELGQAIRKYRHLLKDLSPEYVKDKTNELVNMNADKAIRMLIEYGLLNVIPLSKAVSEALIAQKMLYYAFDEK